MDRHVIAAELPGSNGSNPPDLPRRAESAASSEQGGPRGARVPTSDDATGQPDAPVAALRGAGVDVDVRLVGRIVAGLCLTGLAVASAVLFVVGAHVNAQIDSLRADGRPVTVTVTRCIGLLGGSGSNPAGYACAGTLTLGGHRYHEAIPGSTLYGPGSRIAGVAVPGDPPLLSTPHVLAAQHASASAFVVPTLLLVVLVAAVAAIVVRRRGGRRSAVDPAS